MLCVEGRLPRELGYGLNIAVSLLMWRGLIMLCINFAHWANSVAH